MVRRTLLALSLGGLGLMVQGRCARIRRQGHHPALPRPLLECAREIIGDSAARAVGEAEFDVAFLEAHEMDISLERALEHDVTLLAGHRHHILEPAQPHGRRGGRSGLRLGCGRAWEVASAMFPETDGPEGAARGRGRRHAGA